MSEESKSPNKAKSSARRREWIGASISMPTGSKAQKGVAHLETVIWMAPTGRPAVQWVSKPDETPLMAAKGLARALDAWPTERAHLLPTHLRVAHADWVDVLQKTFPDLSVECTQTPELDRLLKAIAQPPKENSRNASFLSPGVSEDAMRMLFHASAALFRAEPWKKLTHKHSNLLVDVSQLGIRNAVAVLKQEEGDPRAFGIFFFWSVTDHLNFLDAYLAFKRGEMRPVPPHFIFHFQPYTALSTSQQNEADESNWEVATDGAYPRLCHVDADFGERPPSAAQVAFAQVFLSALASLFENNKGFGSVWDEDPLWLDEGSAKSSQGDMDVLLRAYSVEMSDDQPSPDQETSSAEKLSPSLEEQELAAIERERLHKELALGFRESPEGLMLKKIYASNDLMFHASKYECESVLRLSPSALSMLVFNIIPPRAWERPGQAPGIINELRAFIQFLEREHGLSNADDLRDVIGEGAVVLLRSILAENQRLARLEAPWLASLVAKATGKQEDKRNSKKMRKAKKKASSKSRRKNR